MSKNMAAGPEDIEIDIVGGPANGQKIRRPSVPTVNVPVPLPSGIGQFVYTLRRTRDQQGRVVELLAPAGRDIDPNYLIANKLKG